MYTSLSRGGVYTPKSTTLLSIFGVSTEEEKSLTSIVSFVVNKRGKKGRVSREEYLADARVNRKIAREMYEEGCSVTKIASYLECAISSVNNYLSFQKYNKNKKKGVCCQIP